MKNVYICSHVWLQESGDCIRGLDSDVFQEEDEEEREEGSEGSGSDEDYIEVDQAGAASDAAQVSRYRYCCRVFPELWHLNVGGAVCVQWQ